MEVVSGFVGMGIVYLIYPVASCDGYILEANSGYMIVGLWKNPNELL